MSESSQAGKRFYNSEKSKSKPKAKWRQISPVPQNEQTAEAWNKYKFNFSNRTKKVTGYLDETYRYEDEVGKLLFLVGRYKLGITGAEKEFVPFSYREDPESGDHKWRPTAADIPRALYGLPLLKTCPLKRVLIVEGEKAANAARKLLADFFVVITWPGGNSGVGLDKEGNERVDWTKLVGRTVVIWPDNDPQGFNEVAQVVASLRRLGIEPKQVDVPPIDKLNAGEKADGTLKGWDLADPIPDWLDVRKLIADAPNAPTPEENSEAEILIADNVVDRINEEFAYIEVKGKVSVLNISRNTTPGLIKYTLMSKTDFQDKLANWPPIFVDGKLRPAFQIWWQSPRRREYLDGIEFYPGEWDNPSAYNPWTGFAVKPSETGSCRKFKRYLFHNICKKNVRLYKWIFTWLAHLFQRPWERVITCLVIVGKSGTGKSFIGEKVLQRLLGRAYYQQPSGDDRVFRRFNARDETCLLFHIDEAMYSGDHKTWRKLLGKITKPNETVEAKHHEEREVEDYSQSLITSEHAHVLNVNDRARRFTITEPDDHFITVKEHNEIMDELEHGGFERLMWELMNWNLKRADILINFETPALDIQRIESFDAITSFVYNELSSGVWFIEANRELGGRTEHLHQKFLDHCNQLRLPHYDRKVQSAFTKRLRKLIGGEFHTEHKSRATNPVSRLVFPTLKSARARFCEETGLNPRNGRMGRSG